MSKLPLLYYFQKQLCCLLYQMCFRVFSEFTNLTREINFGLRQIYSKILMTAETLLKVKRKLGI